MKIGEVIRKYRKEKGMTQDELAGRLGVTAPAVNKWENGNACPDIGLLAPLARLLEITTDVLEMLSQIAESLEDIYSFRKSWLYSHMKFNDTSSGELFLMLKKAVKIDRELDFIRDDPRYVGILDKLEKFR